MGEEKFEPGVGRIVALDDQPPDSPAGPVTGDEFEKRFGTAFIPDEEPQELNPEDKEVWDRIPAPVGWRILIRPYTGAKMSKSGTIHLADSGTTREALATVVGYVLKMGALCYKDPRKFGVDPVPWCKEGDWVLIGKYAGSRFRLYFDTGENPEVRMINDDEVIGTIIDPDDVRTL
jgi:co-chaperonin GroES (HSP10)